MKTSEGRARKIATLVAMLERGETIVPQSATKRLAGGTPKRTASKTPAPTKR
jgi:hypothetical protein